MKTIFNSEVRGETNFTVSISCDWHRNNTANNFGVHFIEAKDSSFFFEAVDVIDERPGFPEFRDFWRLFQELTPTKRWTIFNWLKR